MYTAKREFIDTGWTNRVIKVNTCGGDYIFRFPKTKFWKHVIKTENVRTRFLSEHIPTVNQKLKYYKGQPYTVHRWIEGVPLSLAFPEMNEMEKQSIADELVNYLLNLQKVETKSKDWERLSDFLKRLAKSTKNNEYDFATLDNLVQQENLCRLVIAHGDFNADNIIVKDNKLTMVIDYAFCTLSSPFADFARICNRMPAIQKYMLQSLINMWDYVDANYKNYMMKGI